MSARVFQSALMRVISAEDRGELLDGVHGAALAPAGLRLLRVAGAPLDRDARLEDPAAGDPRLEPGRLAAEAGVGAVAAPHDLTPTGARGLLVGHGGDEEVAGEADAEAMEQLDGQHEGGDRPLHVVGAAPVEEPVAHLGAERVAEPLLARFDVDGVDVAAEEEGARWAGRRRAAGGAGGAAGSGAREAGDELRPPHEVEAGGTVRVAGLRGLGLPEVDLGPGRGETARDGGLERGFVARRLAAVARRRVVRDELGGEADELVARRPRRLDHLELELVNGPLTCLHRPGTETVRGLYRSGYSGQADAAGHGRRPRGGGT